MSDSAKSFTDATIVIQMWLEQKVEDNLKEVVHLGDELLFNSKEGKIIVGTTFSEEITDKKRVHSLLLTLIEQVNTTPPSLDEMKGELRL